MTAKVRKWGNSLGVIIPKPVADQIRLREGESVDFKVKDDQIIITKKKYDLATLLAQVKPENIHKETDIGEPVGREIL